MGNWCSTGKTNDDLLLPGIISNSSLLHLIGRDEELKILDCTYNSGKQRESYLSTFQRIAIPGYVYIIYIHNIYIHNIYTIYIQYTIYIYSAQFLDIHSLQNEVGHQFTDIFPSQSTFTARMRRLGIRPQHKIVCYTQAADSVQYASRARFILKAWGYKDVVVLNGCLESWERNGFATAPGEMQDNFDGGAGYEMCKKHIELFVTMDEIVNKIKQGGMQNFPQIIDATTSKQRVLESRPLARKLGHIPNAFKLEISSLLFANGEFKPRSELLSQYRQLGKYIYIYI